MVRSADESESLGVEDAGERKGPSTPTLVGQVIGERYAIERELGRGGMGAVYRAQHVTLGRPVAVKVLHPKLTADPAVSKRFDREALAASKLDHPNCVQVIDFGTTSDGMKYLVMQLLEGKELRDEMGWPMNPQRAVRLSGQILRALEHAHRKGLVHRDLKPENVFIVRDDDGHEHVKLVDFGIVKLLDAEDGHEKLTRAGLVFGTPRYMAPEQAAGGKIDERTDLYAVGILMHEMLSGKPPFDADEPTIVLRMHMLADPPPLPDNVPMSVASVVARLLSKSPGDRHASAKEARTELEVGGSTLVGAHTSAASATPPQTSVPPPDASPEPAVALQAPAPPLRVPPVVAPPAPPFPQTEPPPVAASTSQPTLAISSPASASMSGPMTVAMPPPSASGGVPFPAPDADPSAPHGVPTDASGPVPIPAPGHGLGMPPSGAFKTVVALEAQSHLRLPRRRSGGLAILIVPLLVVLGALVLYGVFMMRGCPGGSAVTSDDSAVQTRSREEVGAIGAKPEREERGPEGKNEGKDAGKKIKAKGRR